MKRRLYDVIAYLFLGVALAACAFGIARAQPNAAALFIAPIVLFAVITYTQRLPVTSLNLSVQVTPENSARIEPAARDFLALIKALTMMLTAWINCWAVLHLPMVVFFTGEGAFLIALFASIVMFVGRMSKLA
jgi:hypothetical protein